MRTLRMAMKPKTKTMLKERARLIKRIRAMVGAKR